ncbi:oxidoreductase, partial [Rhizobium sp. Pop5]
MMTNYPTPPFPSQKQPMPGFTAQMDPVPDHGEESYRGADRLKGKRAIITGGDSGIGRAVAIAYAREGADLVISYLDEDEDADETKRLVERAGRKAVLVSGDIQDPAQCRQIVETAVKELGGIDILVNNAAHQASFKSIDEISDEEWELTFKVNIHAMFYLTKAAVAHMKPGSAIINTASINSDSPNPTLLAYATTKGAIQN